MAMQPSTEANGAPWIDLDDLHFQAPYSDGDVVPTLRQDLEEVIAEPELEQVTSKKSREFAVRHIQMMALSKSPLFGWV
jgi:hypothetical protein